MADGRRPRLAFVGLGWIGRHRMAAIAESGLADICVLVDPDPAACAEARLIAPEAPRGDTLEDALSARPDGLVLATPNALHAKHTTAALAAGVPVFCQKPLGRHAAEVAKVVLAAREADLLLGGDFSYRFTTALRRVHDLIRSGELGHVFAVDLAFHNAYGPDKSWFYDVRHSGGGCLLDLGIHLVDFIHWTFDGSIATAHAQLFANGTRLPPNADAIEDFATGTIVLTSGTAARIACSWRVSAGCDAQIGFTAYGTRGGAAFRNVNGSFYDFVAERYRGTATELLCSPPDAWGGRAIVAWVRQLAVSRAYDPAIETAVRAAATLDLLYGRPVDAGVAAFTARPPGAARAVSARP